jgi:hypothetical protein
VSSAVYTPRREARAREEAERRARIAELISLAVCLDCGEPGNVDRCQECAQLPPSSADTRA